MEFDRRIQAKIQGMARYVATAEDVILAKLEWAKLHGSQRQIDDVTRLPEVRSAELDLPYIQRCVAALGLTVEWEAAQRGLRTARGG